MCRNPTPLQRRQLARRMALLRSGLLSGGALRRGVLRCRVADRLDGWWRFGGRERTAIGSAATVDGRSLLELLQQLADDFEIVRATCAVWLVCHVRPCLNVISQRDWIRPCRAASFTALSLSQQGPPEGRCRSLIIRRISARNRSARSGKIFRAIGPFQLDEPGRCCRRSDLTRDTRHVRWRLSRVAGLRRGLDSKRTGNPHADDRARRSDTAVAPHV